MFIKNILFGLTFITCLSCQSSGHKEKNKSKHKDKENSDMPAVQSPAQDESQHASLKYDLQHPVKNWVLADSLIEISGISWSKENELIAIEDLHPNLYQLSLGDKVTITKNVPFLKSDRNKVDIEDVAIAGNTIYAIWSHGTVYKITDWQNNLQVKSIETKFSKENNTEGMCYDPDNNKLLLACKDENEMKDEKKSTRAVYTMDLQTETVSKEPFLVIRKKDFKKLEGDKFDFYPSAIAVHPVSHHIYVLSTRDTKCLAEYSPAGDLLSFQYIDKDLLPQPEGLCFSPTGTMYICTEGRHKQPARLLQFDPLK